MFVLLTTFLVLREHTLLVYGEMHIIGMIGASAPCLRGVYLVQGPQHFSEVQLARQLQEPEFPSMSYHR